MTLWTFLAFALDAIAIAAQAITGRYAGRRRPRQHPGGHRPDGPLGRCAAGSATGLLLAALAPVLGWLFTTDPAVRDLLLPVLLVAAVFQPVAGVVFVLDGVLIGAGDGRYLAWGGAVVLAVFAPLALGSRCGTPPTAPRRWSGCGSPSASGSWPGAPWCWYAAPEAPPGWSPAADLERSGPRLSARVGRRPPPVGSAYSAHTGEERRRLMNFQCRT